MLKRALLVSAFFGQLVCTAAFGQNGCSTTGQSKLYCLIPTALHTPPGDFNFFNTSFATALSQLPLATPASGFVFQLVNGVLTESDKSFGPIMTERGETIGRHKLFVAFTFQQFSFDNIDGTGLGNVPILLSFHNSNETVYTATTNHISATVNQYAGFATFGLTDRVDISIAVPIERVSLGMASSGTEYAVGGAQASFQEYIPGIASGFGDVVLAAKGTAWYSKDERTALAFGAELRLPSGDALNFLGSGAVGIKPYVALSRAGRISPHANLGYQWNSDSVLAQNANGQEEQLPTSFFYYFGADLNAAKRLTLVADFLGQEVFNAPRISAPTVVNVQSLGRSFPSVEPYNGSYADENMALGFKLNPGDHFLLTGNVLLRLNHGGLRSDVVPLVGVSYTH